MYDNKYGTGSQTVVFLVNSHTHTYANTHTHSSVTLQNDRNAAVL